MRYADDLRMLKNWRNRASPADIAAAIEWHDFSIRQQLRRHILAEELIEANVLPLLVIGPEARRAAPLARIPQHVEDLLTKTSKFS